MNFLAHFLLSHHNEELLAGNFIADHVKGSRWKDYPEGISRGILHHRFIDDFTDSHENTRQLSALLRPVQGKYAPVAADICYDYMLAGNFEKFSDKPLSSFAAEVYENLRKYAKLYPMQAVRTLAFMQSGDWLSAYATEEGIERAFTGMSSRVRFSNRLNLAPAQLREHSMQIKALFMNFFPEMQEASRTYLENFRNKDRF